MRRPHCLMATNASSDSARRQTRRLTAPSHFQPLTAPSRCQTVSACDRLQGLPHDFCHAVRKLVRAAFPRDHDAAALPRLPEPEGPRAHPQAASAAKVAADSARDAQPAAQSGKQAAQQAAGDTAAAVKDAAPGGAAGDIFGQIAAAAKGAVPDAPKDAAKDAARGATQAVRDVAPPPPAAPKEAVQVGFPSPAPFLSSFPGRPFPSVDILSKHHTRSFVRRPAGH